MYLNISVIVCIHGLLCICICFNLYLSSAGQTWQGMQITSCSGPPYALIWTFWIPLPTFRHTQTFRHLTSTFRKSWVSKIRTYTDVRGNFSGLRSQLAFLTCCCQACILLAPVSSHLQQDLQLFCFHKTKPWSAICSTASWDGFILEHVLGQQLNHVNWNLIEKHEI